MYQYLPTYYYYLDMLYYLGTYLWNEKKKKLRHASRKSELF